MMYLGVLSGLPSGGCYFRLWGVALGGLPLVGVTGLVFLGGWCLCGYMFGRFLHCFAGDVPLTIPWLYGRLALGWAGLIVEGGRGCSATCRELAGLVGLVVAWVPLTRALVQINYISPVASGQKMLYFGALRGLPSSGC